MFGNVPVASVDPFLCSSFADERRLDAAGAGCVGDNHIEPAIVVPLRRVIVHLDGMARLGWACVGITQ